MKAKTKRQKPQRSYSSMTAASRSTPLSIETRFPKPALQDKLTVWLQGMNKSLDVYRFLAKAAESSLLKLQVPETLLIGDETLFLFTDSTGTLRLVKGEMAVTDFLAMAGEKHRHLKNANPQGVRFPKFITFTAAGRLEYTMRRASDVRRYIAQHTHCRVQRYVWPKDYSVKKIIVRWRRTKRSKVYILAPRGGLRPGGKREEKRSEQEEEFTLDMAFVTTTSNLKIYDVTKERVSEELEQMLEVLTRMVSRYILASSERLEELVVSITSSQSGKAYFLNLPGAKVSMQEEELSAQATEHKSDVSPLSREYDISERLKSKLLPYISLSDVSEQSDRLYQLQLHSSQLPVCDAHLVLSDARIAQHLNEVSAQFDTVLKESQALKREFGIVMKVQLNTYPKNLLENVVRKVYENIARDPRLSKYYVDKTRIFTKLMFAVKAVFLAGLSKNIRTRMRNVHMGMGITDSEFDLYVRYFCEAMESLGVQDEHVEQTRIFLEYFRGDVVQRLLNSAPAESE